MTTSIIFEFQTSLLNKNTKTNCLVMVVVIMAIKVNLFHILRLGLGLRLGLYPDLLSDISFQFLAMVLLFAFNISKYIGPAKGESAQGQRNFGP